MFPMMLRIRKITFKKDWAMQKNLRSPSGPKTGGNSFFDQN
jgi:hypothetical protein